MTQILILSEGHFAPPISFKNELQLNIAVFIVDWEKHSNFTEATIVLREPYNGRPKGAIMKVTASYDDPQWAQTFLTVDV